MEYFYHLKPETMYGKLLLPLSDLKDEYPKLYKEKIKSYKGRDEILNKEVPLLNCEWKDVLFLSCLNPEIIFASLEMLGLLDDKVPDILKFPISCLDGKKFCSYQELDSD